MIKPNPINGTGSKLEPVNRIRYSKMAIPTCECFGPIQNIFIILQSIIICTGMHIV